MKRIPFIALALWVFTAALYAGQDPVLDRGYNVDGVYASHEVDDVNLFNGNLQLTVPLGQSYKTNGTLTYQFALHYNSNFWEYQDLELAGGSRLVLQADYFTEVENPYAYEESDMPSQEAGAESYISPEFNAGAGWILSLGELPSYLLFISGDGARHGFYATLHGPDPPNYNYRLAQYLYTRDGTYIRMKRIPDANNAEKYRELQFQNGVRQRFKCVANCASNANHSWLLDQIADPFGNVLWVSRSPATRPATGLWTWTFTEAVRKTSGSGTNADAYYADHDDSSQELAIVRQHGIDFMVQDALYMHAITVRLASPNGPDRPAVYQLKYVPNADIYRNHANSWAGFGLVNGFKNNGKIEAKLLEQIVLPPPTTGGVSAGEWRFDYHLETQGPADDDPFDPADVLVERTWGNFTYKTAWYSGLLYRATLPTKGAIQYRWGRRGIPQRSCDPLRRGERRSYGTPSVARRQVFKADGTKDGGPWLYFGRGIWDLTIDCGAPREYLSTVIDPLGNTNVNFFSIYIGSGDGYWDHREFGSPGSKFDPVGSGSSVKFISSQVYSCSHSDFFAIDPEIRNDRLHRIVHPPDPGSRSCGNPIRSEYVRYRNSGFNCDPAVITSCTAVNRLVHGSRTVYHDDPVVNTFSDTEYSDFDGLGHFRTATLTGSGGFAGQSREEYTNFNPGMNENNLPSGSAWLLTTWSEQSRKQGSQKARTYTSFDPITGFLTAERRLSAKGADPGLSKNDILTLHTRTRDSLTPTVTTVDLKNYGGDLQDLSLMDTQKFSPNGNAPAFHQLTRSQYGTPSYSEYRDGAFSLLTTLDDTVDPNTGLVTVSVSTAGARTTYSYDNLGRLTSVTPETDPSGASNYLREASIGYLYQKATGSSENDRAQVLMSRPAGCTTNCLSQMKTLFDHMGRPYLTQKKMPAANVWSRELKQYGPTGWLEAVSTPHKSGDVVYSTQYSYVDPATNARDVFGRARQITAPDNFKTNIGYGGVRTVNREVENVKGVNGHLSIRTYEEYDRFGRLVKVSDHSDPTNENSVPATYTYDVGDRLTEVKVSGAVNQTRTFAYDHRGFMTSENHPEIGKVLNYGEFDARGHARRRYFVSGDPLNVRLEFDKAERLKKITPEGTPDRPLLELSYFDSNTDECGTNSGLAKGQLRLAVRHNLVPDPVMTARKVDYTVAETFLYRGVEGRMSHRTTTVSRPGNGGVLHFNQGFRYNALGRLSETEYPMCPECGGTGPARTVLNSYSFGYLTGVSNYASIDYHINGMVNEIVHTTQGMQGQNVRDIHGVDDNSIFRPSKIYTKNVIGTDWNPQGTLQYSYDGAGNVDGVTDSANTNPSREVYRYDKANRLVRAIVGGPLQEYTYDRFGNLTSINGVTIGVNMANNRLSNAQYNDGSGTVKALGGYAYDYDQLNMMRHAFGAGLGKIFLYTASNQRIATIDYKAKNASNVTTVRETWTIRGDRDQVLRVFDNLGGVWTWNKDYVYRGSKLLASTGAEGERRYHLDHLGTPRLITDGNGRRVAAHSYFPFGHEISNPDTDTEVMKFTGHERDNNNSTPGARDGDLDYMHARYYTPALGRFLSPDPLLGAPARPQSWNRYAYALNNPVAFTDPTGAWAKNFAGNANDPDGDGSTGCNLCSESGTAQGSDSGEPEPARRADGVIDEGYGDTITVIAPMDPDAPDINSSTRGQTMQTVLNVTDFSINWAETSWTASLGFTDGLSLGVGYATQLIGSAISDDYARKVKNVNRGAAYFAGAATGAVTFEILSAGALPPGPVAPPRLTPKPRIRGRYGEGQTIRWEPWPAH